MKISPVGSTSLLLAAALLVSAPSPLLADAMRVNLSSKDAELSVVKNSDNVKILDQSWVTDPEKKARSIASEMQVNNEWSSYSLTFQAAQGTTVKLRIAGEFSKNSEVWVYIDDVKVDGASISNGDFEDSSPFGGAKGWFLQKYEGKQGEILSQPDKAASGSNFAKVAYPMPAVQSFDVPGDTPVTITMKSRLAD